MLRSKWTGQYGYYQCRMKVPRGLGMWLAFWLNPEDKRWPPEIDVVEVVNNGRDSTRKSFHFLHWRDKRTAKAHFSRLGNENSYLPAETDYASGFHTFAVEWLPDRIRNWVDDILIADREFRWIHDNGSEGGPAHLLVDMSVSGKWPGPPKDLRDFPARLQVAHIRVWQE